MDGMDVAIVASINIVALATTVYYLKGKIEQMSKQYENDQQQVLRYIDTRINDLKQYVSDRFDDLYKMFNIRIKNIEGIIYKED